MAPSNQHNVKGTRRHHSKSRTGCLECKRRRVKCDEARPACTRCVLGLDKCVYPTTLRSAAKNQIAAFHKSCPSTDTLTPSPSASPYSDQFFSSYSSAQHTPAKIEPALPLPFLNPAIGLSDDDLYQHYINHTSQSLSLSPIDYNILHQTVPALALDNSTVYHALLAVSAAHIAWTMISSQPVPAPTLVNKVLLAGYRHCNRASERMRIAMSKPEIELDPLVASALLLVPFATASQQINHWVSKMSGNSASGAREARKRLESTPRDVIVIMRGVRALLQSANSGVAEAHRDWSPMADADCSAVQIPVPGFSCPALSRTHFMSGIIAKTSAAAFSSLRRRIDLSSQCDQKDFEHLAACKAAFEVLESIGKEGLGAKSPHSSCMAAQSYDSSYRTSSQLSPSLHSFAQHSFALSSVSPQPLQALTRFFLSFFIRVPQPYLDLVLPLLDQRLESPCVPVQLDEMQALALDVYAHWSVLMFLIEEESWWIGTLPEVTLEGMVNRYGEGDWGGYWGGTRG